MEHNRLFSVLEHEEQHTILTAFAQLEESDVKATNEKGQTLLHLAVHKNQLAVAALLLSQGSCPNQKDATMLSPFIAAAANGLSEMFQLILQFSPDLLEVNRFGGTALLPSSEKGFLLIVQQALDAGVPVNHANRLGWTALLEAVILGDGGFLYQMIVEELLVHGADVTIPDFDGYTALDYVQQSGNENMMTLLKQGHIISDFSEIKQLIRRGDYYQALKQLLAMGESLERCYYLGYTYECLSQYKTAKYYYQQGLKDDPQFAYYLANLAKKSKDVEQALVYFDLGAKSNNQVFFLYHKSNYLREMNRHPEALAIMNKLLANNPTRVDYLFHKANSLRSLGKHQEAYEAMMQARRLQPENDLFLEHAIQSKDMQQITK